jgi:hypothetical protein
VTVRDDATLWRSAFSLTLLLSAALLFALQPMIARLLLPRVGGAAAVWTTCLVFFQTALVAGYFYAHVLTRRLSVRRQVLVHAVLLATAARTLPVDIASMGTPPISASPVLWLLGVLTRNAGLPFIALSATTPLLLSWFSRARPTSDAYRLYSASNLGSFIGLLAYPLVIEPALDLRTQSHWWAIGFVATGMLIVGGGIATWRRALDLAPDLERSPRPEWTDRARWIVLASLPASLTISVTTYISTDIAAIPLVWVLPLSLYLLTLVLAFARPSTSRLLQLIVPISLLPPAVGMLTGVTRPVWLHVPLHLVAFFAASLACHQALARSRPHHDRLPEFYLWMALGGAAGGLATALIAPVIFSTPIEYPIGLLLTAFAGTTRDRLRARIRWSDLAAPAIAALLVVSLAGIARWLGWSAAAYATRGITFIPALIAAVLFWPRPRAFMLALAATFIAGSLASGIARQTLVTLRSFYGVHRVDLDDSNQYHLLIDGSTIHGIQALDPDRRHECLSYYSRIGPAGQAFDALLARPETGAPHEIAVLGLGTGAMLCFAGDGQSWTFFEIDPAVVKLAGDPRYFTYLSDAAAPVSIVLGDARLSLARDGSARYDVIVVDVFSSDAIPVHLLTREAMSVLLERLAPGGVILFHISNLYLELRPVVGAAAHDAGLTAFGTSHEAPSSAADVYGTEWVAVARSPRDFGPLTSDPRWTEVSGTELPVWTDQHASLVPVFRLRR